VWTTRPVCSNCNVASAAISSRSKSIPQSASHTIDDKCFPRTQNVAALSVSSAVTASKYDKRQRPVWGSQLELCNGAVCHGSAGRSEHAYWIHSSCTRKGCFR
jgi:response regulator of citrate/malate metabolism